MDRLYRVCPVCKGAFQPVKYDPLDGMPLYSVCERCNNERYVPVVTPEPDAEVRDVLAESFRETADAGLAALRAKGFAVVRTADVEAALDLALGGEEHTPETDRLKEAIR